MRHPVHKLCIYLVPDTSGFCTSGRSRCSLSCAVIDRNISRNCLFYQFIRLADPVRHLTLDYFLSVKAFHGYLSIGRYDNAVRITDFLVRQDILGSA